eukprot:Hpha_TRINITY_DN31619_c0_g1::TRINITY_DN31619_c0_g1_i1::g.29200::m.29200
MVSTDADLGEVQFSGEDLVLGVLASHASSGRRGATGLGQEAVGQLALRKAGDGLPPAVREGVGDWLPVVLQGLLRKGLVENVNASLRNVRPVWSLSDKGKRRAETGTLSAGATEVAAAPVQAAARGSGRREMKRKKALPVRISAATWAAARRLAVREKERVEPKQSSVAAAGGHGTEVRRKAAVSLRDRKRAELLRELRGQATSDQAASQPPGGGVVLGQPAGGGAVLGGSKTKPSTAKKLLKAQKKLKAKQEVKAGGSKPPPSQPKGGGVVLGAAKKLQKTFKALHRSRRAAAAATAKEAGTPLPSNKKRKQKGPAAAPKSTRKTNKQRKWKRK